jgi:hypothetical protein
MTTSLLALEGDEVNDFDRSPIRTSTPNASSECTDCVIKDKKIKDLLAIIEDLKESGKNNSRLYCFTVDFLSGNFPRQKLK